MDLHHVSALLSQVNEVSQQICNTDKVSTQLVMNRLIKLIEVNKNVREMIDSTRNTYQDMCYNVLTSFSSSVDWLSMTNLDALRHTTTYLFSLHREILNTCEALIYEEIELAVDQYLLLSHNGYTISHLNLFEVIFSRVPYPSKIDLDRMSLATGVTCDQVQRSFRNRRYRSQHRKESNKPSRQTIKSAVNVHPFVERMCCVYEKSVGKGVATFCQELTQASALPLPVSDEPPSNSDQLDPLPEFNVESFHDPMQQMFHWLPQSDPLIMAFETSSSN